ncbi:unnamed protein product, partial [Cuscuta epithymum]
MKRPNGNLVHTYKAQKDRQSRKLIGTGERWDGLYYFKQDSRQCVAVNGVDLPSDLWHKRLGHPSENLIKSLSSVDSSVVSPCDICFRAKQTCEVFPLSDNKASRIFYLSHIDVWGPCLIVSTCGAKSFLTIVDDF